MNSTFSSAKAGQAGFRAAIWATTMIALWIVSSAPALAQKGKGGGGGNGGGGGGGDTGAESIVNPAFVFKKDGALHLLNHSGSQQLSLTKPPKQAEDSPGDWSPNGTRFAFFRQPDANYTPRDLYVVNLFEDASGVAPALSEETLVLANVSSGLSVTLSWGPTGEIVVNDDLCLYAVDPSAANPSRRVLIDFSENGDASLPAPDGFPAGLQLQQIRSVDVQPVVNGTTVTIAFNAAWNVDVVNGDVGSDVLLVDADVSTGRLVVDRSTLRNLTNPTYADAPYLPPNIDWSRDGFDLTFQEWHGIDNDPNRDQQIVSYNFLTNEFTVLVVGDPEDGSAAPNLPHSLSPDGLEIALGVGTPVKGGTTYDVFRVPGDKTAYNIRGPLAVNVTNTLRSSARESDPVWRPTWTR